MSPASVVAAAGPAISTPRGPTVDIFNIGGGRYRTCGQQPPGGPPSMSLASVVAAAEPTASTPRVSTVDFFNISGGRCQKS
jgi:hypothetical protein